MMLREYASLPEGAHELLCRESLWRRDERCFFGVTGLMNDCFKDLDLVYLCV